MPVGVEEIALYAAYTKEATPPRWLEAAPNDRAHRELEEIRPVPRGARCHLADALARQVAKGPRR